MPGSVLEQAGVSVRRAPSGPAGAMPPVREELIALRGKQARIEGCCYSAPFRLSKTLFVLASYFALRHAEEGINLYNIHEHRTTAHVTAVTPRHDARMMGSLAAPVFRLP